MFWCYFTHARIHTGIVNKEKKERNEGRKNCSELPMVPMFCKKKTPKNSPSEIIFKALFPKVVLRKCLTFHLGSKGTNLKIWRQNLDAF